MSDHSVGNFGAGVFLGSFLLLHAAVARYEATYEDWGGYMRIVVLGDL